ncbi:disease resistance protein RPP13-like [Salvia miltiorrhiza]|uniref:disease resistance protein RPP13-like n=1 Tax=Salvia miltiorrhiza TaxID=226208 RepID=UPI0025AB6135|nr:disease resistance protein RPP13-like [Salvia miltiorrhiza]
MAYPAVISLKQTLHRLLHSSHHTFLNTRKLLKYAYNQTISLQQLLKRLDDCRTQNLDAVDEQIREETHKLEDLLEFHDSNHFLRRETNKRKEISASCQNSEEISQGIQSFCKTVDKITKDSVAEIGHFSPEQEHDADLSDAQKGTISVDYDGVMHHLTQRMRPNDFGIFQINGLPGSGATVAAAAVFEDLKHCFDCRARVRVGPRYECKEILLGILAQINEPNELLIGKGEAEIGEFLYASLKGRKYLILMDDVRDVEVWKLLESSFPVEENGSAVVLTTTRQQSQLLEIRNRFMIYNMACRDEESWWFLFRSNLFGQEPCPTQLEEAGKKIVDNCRSLGVVVFTK